MYTLIFVSVRAYVHINFVNTREHVQINVHTRAHTFI